MTVLAIPPGAFVVKPAQEAMENVTVVLASCAVTKGILLVLALTANPQEQLER